MKKILKALAIISTIMVISLSLISCSGGFLGDDSSSATQSSVSINISTSLAFYNASSDGTATTAIASSNGYYYLEAGIDYIVRYDAVLTGVDGAAIVNVTFSFDKSLALLREGSSVNSSIAKTSSDDSTTDIYTGKVYTSFTQDFIVTPYESGENLYKVAYTADDSSTTLAGSTTLSNKVFFTAGQIETPTITKYSTSDGDYIRWSSASYADYYEVYEGVGTSLDTMDYSCVEIINYSDNLSYQFTKVPFGEYYYAYYIIAYNNVSDDFKASEMSNIVTFS